MCWQGLSGFEDHDLEAPIGSMRADGAQGLLAAKLLAQVSGQGWPVRSLCHCSLHTMGLRFKICQKLDHSMTTPVPRFCVLKDCLFFQGF